jgi:hypothetical protein
MSLDIALTSTTYQVGNRQWLLAIPDVKFNATLDITKFTAGTHYPNGFIPSGTAVGVVTATGLYSSSVPERHRFRRFGRQDRGSHYQVRRLKGD